MRAGRVSFDEWADQHRLDPDERRECARFLALIRLAALIRRRPDVRSWVVLLAEAVR